MSGIEEFVLANAPSAINMPCATYDEYFAGPWAAEREYEAKHRELTKSIGETLKGLCSFLAKYSIHLFIFRAGLYMLHAAVWDNAVHMHQGEDG